MALLATVNAIKSAAVANSARFLYSVPEEVNAWADGEFPLILLKSDPDTETIDLPRKMVTLRFTCFAYDLYQLEEKTSVTRQTKENEVLKLLLDVLRAAHKTLEEAGVLLVPDTSGGFVAPDDASRGASTRRTAMAVIDFTVSGLYDC